MLCYKIRLCGSSNLRGNDEPLRVHPNKSLYTHSHSSSGQKYAHQCLDIIKLPPSRTRSHVHHVLSRDSNSTTCSLCVPMRSVHRAYLFCSFFVAGIRVSAVCGCDFVWCCTVLTYAYFRRRSCPLACVFQYRNNNGDCGCELFSVRKSCGILLVSGVIAGVVSALKYRLRRKRTVICGSHTNREISEHVCALVCAFTGTKVHLDKEASGCERDDVPKAVTCDDNEL